MDEPRCGNAFPDEDWDDVDDELIDLALIQKRVAKQMSDDFCSVPRLTHNRPEVDFDCKSARCYLGSPWTIL
jgi:hypothetical protein